MADRAMQLIEADLEELGVADRAIRLIDADLEESRTVLDAAANSQEFRDAIREIAAVWSACLKAGGKIMLAGNGGSAGDAQHIAGELVSRLNYDRAPVAGIALTTDTSILTAIGNDYGYDQVFARQVRGLGRSGDVFVGISTSGRSPNVLEALTAAREIGVTTVGFSGLSGGTMVSFCDHLLRVPSDRTPMIQQIHITAAHIICGLVEIDLFPRD
jgi:D-sedoheptulose 7-phosphate isomerase